MEKLEKCPCGGTAHRGKTIFGSHIVSCGRCHAQSAPCASVEVAALMWRKFAGKAEKAQEELARLRSQLAEVTAVRDAAVEDLVFSKACCVCKRDEDGTCGDYEGCNFKWRGLRKEADNADDQ